MARYRRICPSCHTPTNEERGFPYGIDDKRGKHYCLDCGLKLGIVEPMDYLELHGVGTVIHYPIAPHKQKCYAKEFWNTPQLSLLITEQIADQELSLPIGPTITMKEVKQIVEVINNYM